MENTISDVVKKQSLQCKLTQEEMLEYSKQMARACHEKKECEDSLKEVKAEFTAKIQGFESQVNLLSTKISNGYEYRETECELHYHWDDGVKLLYRKDTGDLVKSEPIESWERQERLRLFPEQGETTETKEG